MAGYILGGMELLTQSAETQKTNIYWTVVYIRKGIGMYILDSDLRCLNQGDIIILPPRLSYSFCATELDDEYNVSVDAVVLRFDEAWLNSLLGVFKTLNKIVLKVREIDVPYAVEGPKWMKMSTLLGDLSKGDRSNEPVHLLELLDMFSTKNDMIKILQPSLYEAQSLAEKLEKVERYITSNIYGKVSLEDVSSYLGMNRTYFCLFFKKHYGKGFADYLNDMRIEKAVSLLSVPDKQIADIARECGFKTAPYFTRAFRRAKGITPAEYRKKIK
jgi:AraC-like DNA-binding protein